MRFADIFVDRFGVLKSTEIRDLSRGMTVVYGGNGSGKTTLTSFLRGLLFGYTTDHEAFQSDDSQFGGSVTLESHNRSVRISRKCSHGVSSDLSAVDLATDIPVSAHDRFLPDWVHETVYQEIFSVGYQEAARFDLLTRLCLNDQQTVGREAEIRRVELAIEQLRREREGNGLEGGLRRNLASLEQRQTDLNRQLTELQRVAPTIPARIAELEDRLRHLSATLASAEQQVADLDAQIRGLEEQLESARRRNLVPLDRHKIEQQISQLTQRKQRWLKIRQSVQEELNFIGNRSERLGQPGDSLKSVRALVSRLEQRIETAVTAGSLDQVRVGGLNRELYLEHMRSEVFSLCDYISRHEAAVESHEAALETLLAARTMHDIENMDTVLQGQIDVLQEELTRSLDVLSAEHPSAPGCESSAHADYLRGGVGRYAGSTSIEQLEARLLSLQQQRQQLCGETESIRGQIRRVEAELSDLRARLKSAARLEDIDRIRMQLAQVETQCSQLRERTTVVESTEANLRTVIERLRQITGRNVLELASKYVSRLTDGDCSRLVADASETHILAETRQSERPQNLQQLSRGTRDLVALALRLALITVRGEEGERCPLILDDVFVTADDDGAAAAADLLMEVAAKDQQIIFFTCQKDVLDLFARRSAGIRYLEERPAAIPLAQPALPPPVVVASPPPPQPVAAPVRSAVDTRQHTNWLFYLEVDSSMEDLSGLTVAEVEALRASGLSTINELLLSTVDELESRFRSHGYAISRDRLRAWRGQAELALQIPMLRRSDAELLYAAGIQSTVELSRMRPETVFEMVVQFQNSAPGSRFRRSGRNIDRQQAINWSRWSQHARTLTEARRSRSRFFMATDESESAAPVSTGVSDSGNNGARRRRRLGMARRRTTRRRQPRPRMSLETRRQRDRRQSRRRNRMARHSSSYRMSSGLKDNRSDSDLRFYLNRSDDIEAAPSIGPKTAQRLGRVGIYTVDDLLKAKAEDVAERLNNSRINADTILQWSNQARLVCQVPGLRGHDAQILVACGVTEAEQLSAKRPADLFALVGPFADTTEGERIVRGGKKPDLEEVTDWISWAQHARSLMAAA